MTAQTTIPPYTAALIDAADLLICEAMRHSQALSEIEDKNCEEALLHAMQIESLESMAERILALNSAR